MNRTQALIVALASLTLCSSLPREAREVAPRTEESPVETGAGSSDPQAIGCPPEHLGWILLGLAPILIVAIPIYLAIQGVSWIFKRKPKRSRPAKESAPPPKPEPRPAPEHMTRLPALGWTLG